MAYKVTHTVENEDVAFQNPSEAFYQAVGGAEGMQALMYDFYDIIYQSEIHSFFPKNKEALDKVKVKNTKFFIQLCGGPKVYDDMSSGQDLNDHMIHVHDKFTTSDRTRMKWLECMEQALEKLDINEELKQNFWEYAEAFSKLTVNSHKNDKQPH